LKTIIGFVLLILGAGSLYYGKVVVQARILNIFLHSPNELAGSVPLQMLLRNAKSLQITTEILGYGLGALGLIILFVSFLRRKSDSIIHA
jgi:ascorbate-specific PTS system EIIC-type component UlaA